MTSLKLDVGRWAIAADLHPSPAASARLVQLHGLTSSMARDEILGLNFVHDLPEFETLRYDAPGHGRTRLREDGAHDGQKAVEQDFLWDSLADTLYAVVGDVWPDVTDTRPLVGIGQSMGCATLLTAQVKHPGL
ncbi:MAG TPA: alpha/beta hydrolase, partial [Corynebacterium falsenii]